MAFIDKLMVISDEVYKIRDISLFRLNNTYKCFIDNGKLIKELDIDERYNTMYAKSSWELILTTKDKQDICLIDIYRNKLYYYNLCKDDIREIYRKYIYRNLSKDLISDMSNEDSKKSVLVIDGGTCKTIDTVAKSGGIQCLCDAECENWIISPLDRGINIHNYYKDIIITNDSSCRLIYKNKIYDDTLVFIPDIIDYKGKRYLNCVVQQGNELHHKIKLIDTDAIRDVVLAYTNNIKYTCQEGIILKEDNNGLYELIELGSNKKFKYELRILLEMNLLRYVSLYDYTKDKKLLSYTNEDGQEIAVMNTVDGYVTLGNINDLDIKGDIKKRLIIIIINKANRVIYIVLYKKIYKCLIAFDEAINLDLTTIKLKGKIKEIKQERLIN